MTQTRESFNHIALDLELEQPNDRIAAQNQVTDSLVIEQKIIQVGYVVFSMFPTFEIHKEVSIFINIGVPLSTFIKQLTGIKDSDISSGTTIELAYDQLVEDMKSYKTIRIIKQWGSNDMECLRREVPDKEWHFGHGGFNVKHLYQAFAENNNLNRSGGLSKSMAKCGLMWKGQGKHNGVIDARNTAIMYNYLAGTMKK